MVDLKTFLSLATVQDIKIYQNQKKMKILKWNSLKYFVITLIYT